MIHIPAKKLFSSEQIKDICEIYKEGTASDIIAKKYNVVHRTILNLLKENNIEIRKSGHKKGTPTWNKTKLNPEIINNICNMYKRGISQKEIKIQLGISLPAIKRALKENNIEFRILSEIMQGKHNSPKSQFKKGHKTWNKGLNAESDIRVESYGKKVSIAKKGKYCGRLSPNYGKTPKHGKIYSYISPLQGEIKLIGSYEYKVAQYLDKKLILWYYEPKAFDLFLNGKETTYTPDFYLPDLNLYLEVKGWWRDDAKDKFELFLKEYSNIEIQLLMKEDLKKLGIKV